MDWLTRLYRPTVLELSKSDSGANAATINLALNSAKGTDKAVHVPPGRWPYSGPLWIDSATLAGESDSVLVGSDGTAAPECCVYLGGYSPRLLGLRLEIDASQRGATNYHNGVTLNFSRGGCVRGVAINGPAAYGVSNFGGKNSQIVQVVVADSWADGIHHTYGSQDSETADCVVLRSGDDYYPVVSYIGDPDTTRNILIRDSVGGQQRAPGRGLVVDGGEQIIFRRMVVRNVAERGVYITTEDVFHTRAVNGVLLDDVLVDGCGLNGIDADEPGAAGVWVGRQSARGLSGVVARNVRVRGATGPAAYVWGDTLGHDLSGVVAIA